MATERWTTRITRAALASEETSRTRCASTVSTTTTTGSWTTPTIRGCNGSQAGIENPVCLDGLDNDGDGLVDHPDDLGCVSPFAGIEDPVCMDGLDNDGDGPVDYPDDPGCSSIEDETEAGACQDGFDNDGDGGIDFDGGASANGGVPIGDPDPDCADAADPEECGLLGIELGLVLPFIARSRARRRRTGATRSGRKGLNALELTGRLAAATHR